MTLTLPAYCRKCDRITGHFRLRGGLKRKCARCQTITPVPLFRWFAGTLFMTFMFSVAIYILWSSLSVLWPLFEMPFIDYGTGEVTATLLLVPGYYAFAWLTGKIIR